jgi:hypothetical protein
MKTIRTILGLFFVACAPLAIAQIATAPVTVTLAPGQVSGVYTVDVSAATKALTVSLTGSGGDLDIFVRYGTPFPTAVSGSVYVDGDMLNRYAHYHAISSTSSESITILPSGRFPLKAGTWYVAVANDVLPGHGTGSGTLSATLSNTTPIGSITFDFTHATTDANDATDDCDTSFWTDSTAVTPIGGNPGTTLGDQRKNALDYAGQQLVQQLGIEVPITVHACGAHLGGDSHSAILAHAGPTTFLYDTPQYPTNFLQKKYTWYPSTLAVRLGGSTLCGVGGGPCDAVSNEAIEAVFNEDIGESTIIGGEDFYYGYTPDTTGSDTVDFVSIAMHEMTHGLGFIGLVNTDPTQGTVGAKPGLSTATPGVIAYDQVTDGPYDDIYDDSVAIVPSDASTYQPFLGYEVNGTRDAARAAAMTSGPVVTSSGTYNPGQFTGIRWSDPVAATSSVNINASLPAPNDFPSLYAPCDESKTTTCSTQPSSTLSHTVQTGDMMNAYYSRQNLRSMGLAVPMLAPLGWSNATATAPTFLAPATGNWFDVTHNGHGFDFQLAARDSVNGDIYALTFYTYTSSGKPEWYQATGHLIDGVFIPSLDQYGYSLYRIAYQTTATSIVAHTIDQSIGGNVIVDFNQASTAPACRNVDRSGAPQLGVMYWNISDSDSDTDSYCVQPAIVDSQHGSPDYNGQWFAPSDSGWGFELLDVATGGDPAINVVMYLPGADNGPNWLTGSGSLHGTSATFPLNEATNGYCRTCAPPASQTFSQVGTMTITFGPANADGTYTTGTATIAVAYPGGGSFNRSNIPIAMINIPTGH